MAGPSDRAGFIDAPQIGPANIASSPITAPTAIPAVMPFTAAPVETPRITNIKIAVRISSRTNDWVADPEGTVVPSILFCGKRKCNAPLAARAPVHRLAIYGMASRSGNRRGSKTPRLAAGYRSRPDTHAV